jgi:hypothetical protein
MDGMLNAKPLAAAKPRHRVAPSAEKTSEQLQVPEREVPATVARPQRVAKRVPGQDRALAWEWQTCVAWARHPEQIVPPRGTRHLASKSPPVGAVAVPSEDLAQHYLVCRASAAHPKKR